HRRDRNGCVPVVGRCDVGRVQVCFLCKQLTIVAIRVTPFVRAGGRAAARAIICFDKAASRLAASHSETGSKFVRELQLAGRREVLPPLLVSGTEQLASSR